MINQLDIRIANSNNVFGTVADSVSMGTSACLVGNFDTVNGFKTNSIAIIDTATGMLDKTSSLAIALSTLFSTGSLIRRVLYTTSVGHPCLIFLVGSPGSTMNRCYVFFTDTLLGYNLLSSTPLAWSSPATVQMNSASYVNMKIDDGTGVLVVIGSFYISPFNGNGCAFIDISSIFGGVTNSAVIGVLGPPIASTYSINFMDLEIDSSTSALYLYSNPVTSISSDHINVYSITNNSSPFTFQYSTSPIVNGIVQNWNTGYYQAGPGFMSVSNGRLYVGLYPGPLFIAHMDVSTHVWSTNVIYVIRNQAFGSTYPYGLKTYDGKLYLWGSFSNAFYSQPAQFTQRVLDTNRRQSFAVFDISNDAPTIMGEDMELSKGVPWLTYYPPPIFNPYEQSAWIYNILIEPDGVYLFPLMSANTYAVTPDRKTAIAIYTTNFKNGINFTSTPVKATLDGYDAQSFEANLTF